MSKQLYEEALADVKKLKEVAEDNAKKALIEAVTPRIRDLIENQLMNEAGMGGEYANQCIAAGTAFFFKQWGTWGADGVKRTKHANGREFQGRTWDGVPRQINQLEMYLVG